jgi:cytochrome c peroxidase
MMLPTDLALIEDEDFSVWVDIYANDAGRFFSDFSAAFQKLTELGTIDLTPTEWA